MAPRIRKEQRLCLELLQEKERNGENVTRKEIADYTGWKEKGTVNTYLSKGNLEDYVTVVDKKQHIYKVHNTLGVGVEEFSARITQVHAPVHIVIDDKPKSEPTLSEKLLEKSIHAALSAIEIYNKPDFKYREETFAILMVNAWETLLKAKVVEENGNNLDSIYVKRTKQDGTEYIPTSRSDNPLTIGLFDALAIIKVDEALVKNIEALTEIRDTAIHHINEDVQLSMKVLEIGTATLRSYVIMIDAWFKYDMTKYNFYLMPLSFFHLHELESGSVSPSSDQISKLLEYIAKEESIVPSDENNPHSISLILKMDFVKGSSPSGIALAKNSNDGDTVHVYVSSEEEFGRKYRWTYAQLLEKLKTRYEDFKTNPTFYNLHRELGANKKYRDLWYLNFKERTGTSKPYYDPCILDEFDKHYTKRPVAVKVDK